MFTLKVNTNSNSEIARILLQLSIKFQEYTICDESDEVLDKDGNVVGNWDIASKSNVADEVISVFSQISDVDSEEISLQTNVYSDLGFDSVDMVEAHLELENKYKIGFTDELYESKTIDEIVKFIKQKLHV